MILDVQSKFIFWLFLFSFILTCFNFSWSYWIVFFSILSLNWSFNFDIKRTQTHTIQRFHNMDIIRIRVGWVFHFPGISRVSDNGYAYMLVSNDWLIDLFIYLDISKFIYWVPPFLCCFLIWVFLKMILMIYYYLLIYLFCVTYNLPTYLQVN